MMLSIPVEVADIPVVEVDIPAVEVDIPAVVEDIPDIRPDGQADTLPSCLDSREAVLTFPKPVLKKRYVGSARIICP